MWPGSVIKKTCMRLGQKENKVIIIINKINSNYNNSLK